jgi:aminopeptidase N
LTVFRDQEFTADLRSRPVKRIADVATLMARQFSEDAGPMAHSVRPERYIEINNFYTATVYEKGAEMVRMYQTLLGQDGFRRGLDLYFKRHDGQAVTCDDFLAAMADANHRDLRQFERWYRQVGTPRWRSCRNTITSMIISSSGSGSPCRSMPTTGILVR